MFLPVDNIMALSLFIKSDKIYALLFFPYPIPGFSEDGFARIAGLLSVKAVPFMFITGTAGIPSVLFFCNLRRGIGLKALFIIRIGFCRTVPPALL